jgi:hypothetical protein
MLRDPGANRIQVDVTNELKQVGLLLNEDGLVAFGKHGPDASVAPVLPARIARMNRLHEAPQWHLPRANNEVYMIGHDAPRQHPSVVGLLCGREQAKIVPPLRPPLQQEVPSHAAGDDVKNATRIIDASLSRHGLQGK